MTDTLQSKIEFRDPWVGWSQGQRQRFLKYWSDRSKSDPSGKGTVMCVDMVFGGVHVRVAGRSLVATSGKDSVTYHYNPYLAATDDIQQSLTLGSGSAQARTVQVTVPAKAVPVKKIMESGGIFQGVAEVSLMVDGMDYDLRFVVMRGDINGGVNFGPDLTEFSFTVMDFRYSQAEIVPGVTIDSARWPSAQDSAMGERYPIIINGYPKVPCPRVFDSTSVPKFLIAQYGSSLSPTTAFYNGGTLVGTAASGSTFGTTTDGLGKRAHVINGSPGTFEDKDVMHADVSLVSGIEPLSVVGAIRYLLIGHTSLSNSGLNEDLFSSAEAKMPALTPKMLINANGSNAPTVLEVIENNIIKSFPMVHMVYEGRGMGPVVIDRRVSAGGLGVAGKITIGTFPALQRSTHYTETPKEAYYTEYELRYDHNLMDRTYAGVVRRDDTNSPLCARARRTIRGNRPMSTIQSSVIFDSLAANYVIDWLVAHFSVPYFTVQVQCLPSAFFRYQRGDNVLYTDPDVPVFTDAVATITQMDWSKGFCTMGLKVWHPAWTNSVGGTLSI